MTVHGEAGERVVGVSLCRGSERLQAATAGEDGRVRVWDLTAKPPSLLDEHANHKVGLCLKAVPPICAVMCKAKFRQRLNLV